MPGILKSCISSAIDELTLVEIIEKARDWAMMHGIALRPKTDFLRDSLQVLTLCRFYVAHIDVKKAIAMKFQTELF